MLGSSIVAGVRVHMGWHSAFMVFLRYGGVFVYGGIGGGIASCTAFLSHRATMEDVRPTVEPIATVPTNQMPPCDMITKLDAANKMPVVLMFAYSHSRWSITLSIELFLADRTVDPSRTLIQIPHGTFLANRINTPRLSSLATQYLAWALGDPSARIASREAPTATPTCLAWANPPTKSDHCSPLWHVRHHSYSTLPNPACSLSALPNQAIAKKNILAERCKRKTGKQTESSPRSGDRGRA